MGLLVLLVVSVFVIRSRTGANHIKPGSYLLLDVRGVYTEAPPPDLFGRLLGGGSSTILHLLSTIRCAKVDHRIAGMIVRVGSLDIGWGKAQEIRDALTDFKASNKPVIALLEHEATGSNLEYYVAVAADRVYLAPVVTAPLSGLSAQYTFLGGVWDKLDIEMTVEKVREYKTMGDMIAGKEMSAAHREMANSLLDSVNDQFVKGVAEGRKLDPLKVRSVIDTAPVSPHAFEELGLSDGTKYLQTLHDEQGGDQAPLLRMEDYNVDPRDLGLGDGPKIAIVYGVGPVQMGSSKSTAQGQRMGADTVSQALQDAADDDDVRAILFRIDSPGGSALASDLIWRATRYARAKKPVVVSMSDVAGSGGYYVAAGATKIVAEPATLTGSIGVFMARPNLKKLLANMGIHTETLSRGKFAYLDDVTVPLEPEGRAKIIDELEHIYDEFVDRVAAGRSLTKAEVNAIGRGRVWTGEQAKEKKLVDELGGFRRALEVTKQEAGLDAKSEVQLVFYPGEEGLAERISDLFEARVQVTLPPAIQQLAERVTVPFEDGALLTMMGESIEIR